MVSQSKGESQRATRLFGAAERLREALGSQLPPFIRDKYDTHVTDLRTILGEPTFTMARTEGHAIDLDHAIKYALDDTQAQ